MWEGVIRAEAIAMIRGHILAELLLVSSPGHDRCEDRFNPSF